MSNIAPLFIDPARDTAFKRGIFNAIIAPRPIGWISTVNSEGQANLAPFSYFNIVSNLPPILMFSCNTPEDRDAKDTLANVRATGEFVFNLVSADLAEAMNETSTPVPHHVDEFEHAGIAKAASIKVRAPRVAASPCSLECRVVHTLSFGGDEGPETNITFGQVVGMHIAPGFLHEDGHFDTLAAQPISRLGGAEYAVTQHSFELTRRFTRANEATY
ncbi:MAG TPA: flavin reductase family protein [Sphingomonadaceae bacterium]|nr:flavin reductase family protein [Sphingomonadaceae bacterium]